MRFKFSIDVKVSKLIKRFIVADTALFGGWGFVDPVFSIFIIREIAGASLVTVGIATAIYWVLKSIIQVPIAVYLDKNGGERDDFYALIIGLVVVGIASLGFTMATSVWHIYLIQVIKAVGFALYVATWPSLFSRHLDKGHYSLDWSLDSTSVGIAIGAAGFFGGIVVTWLGYNAVFIAAAITSFISAGILFSVPNIILPPPVTNPLIKDHTPKNITK